ncbi:HECT domain-containing protein [Dioscorea alata]|uniref:HECT domain-containing protein n=1 Tax=Dioscorea alata TaxID=55571 RepID=A0ACB7VIE7_DIOAL|nr:HECT domain-containing protein [Dioscorea alata]
MSKRPQVSLRGASAKEISRDALIEKVSHERELRNYARRASAAALFIQRVWRRFHVMKMVTEQLYEECENLSKDNFTCKSSRWISGRFLRLFLFIATQPSTLRYKMQLKNVACISTCFKILLQSIDSPESVKNYCSLAVGTADERSTWLYQSRKLLLLCFFVLSECDPSRLEGEHTVPLTSLAMRLAISLTDPKSWKCCKSENLNEAEAAAKKLIGFMTTRKSGTYCCIRKYIMKLGAQIALQSEMTSKASDHVLITASAVTLALRPFHAKYLGPDEGDVAVRDASELFFTLILTIPYLTQCLPPFLLAALKHECVLFPSLKMLLISKDKVFEEMSKLDHLEASSSPHCGISLSGWALVNIINLATESHDNLYSSGCFLEGLDYKLYLHVINCLSQNFLGFLGKGGQFLQRVNNDCQELGDCSSEVIRSDICSRVKTTYVSLLKPIYQQWHLLKLLALVKKEGPAQEINTYAAHVCVEYCGNMELQDIVYLYYDMLRIYSILDPFGSLSILNVLAFTPGFLIELWKSLEDSIFHGTHRLSCEDKSCKALKSGDNSEVAWDKKQKQIAKETGNKWVNVLQKIAGKSADVKESCSNNDALNSSYASEDDSDIWDIEPMRLGPQGLSKGMSCILHLFCAIYAHLLLVLDDIEFYEKQVPFSLQQQQRITSVLNTFVYNAFSYNAREAHRPIIDVGIRCLQLLYERDCRRSFCPSSLWLAPARKTRIPIAAAAKAHEAAFTNLHSGGVSASSLRSILTSVPHIYPFKERVQIFREFIKSDKASRRPGEVSGAGLGSIEVVVRRGHIIEDGFRQLNSLGSKLRSSINVSFINESGLAEAGLDYGGLSKEFLTDLARAAFDPQYGIFCQTSTSERFLIPNMSAGFLENGFEMIEFLGRIVGKALYEGILLDYSFSLVFVQKLLGRYSFLDDLSALDPELYRNLIYVKNFDGDVAELSLDFTVTEELCGKRIVSELKPDGKNVCVTNENKRQYVHAVADYKLNRQVLPFANAFYRGLIDLISPSWLSLFNANEFNQLLSGGEHDFDVEDLKINTKYTGGYSEGSRTVKLFWEYMTMEREVLGYLIKVIHAGY